MSGPAVFLDRDGTINRNFADGPVYQIERFELLPGAANAIRRLNDAELPVYVITNQGGINHDQRDFDWDRYRAIEQKMHDLLQSEAEAKVDAVYLCPHADYEDCDCRKPKTGMLVQAFGERPFEPARSFFVGDSTADVIAGQDFGLRTVLVTGGWKDGVAGQLEEVGRPSEQIFPGLPEAAEWILSETGKA